MKTVQTGRLVTMSKKNLRNNIGIITAIQDKNHVIIQTPLTMERKRVSLNTVKLLDLVYEITEDMSPFDVQRVLDSQGAVKTYEDTADYKEWEKENKYKMCSDFERFLGDVKERVVQDVLREKVLAGELKD